VRRLIGQAMRTRTKDPDGFIDGARRERCAIVAEAVREWRAVDTNTANIKRGSPWETATSRASRLSSQRTPRRRDVLLATRSANPYRELAALLQPYQTARARGVRGRARRVAGWARSNGSAGHAGTQANLKLTFQLDQSVGAVRVVALWRHGGDIKRETLRLNFVYVN
jgi:hypothetical protein